MDFGKKRLAYGLKKGKNVVLDDFSVDFSRFVKVALLSENQMFNKK